MNDEMNNQEELTELTQQEEEELERFDGELDPLSLALTAVVGSLSIVGGITIGEKVYKKVLKPGFERVKCAISEKISKMKAKKAQKKSEELEVVEDDEE